MRRRLWVFVVVVVVVRWPSRWQWLLVVVVVVVVRQVLQLLRQGWLRQVWRWPLRLVWLRLRLVALAAGTGRRSGRRPQGTGCRTWHAVLPREGMRGTVRYAQRRRT